LNLDEHVARPHAAALESERFERRARARGGVSFGLNHGFNFPQKFSRPPGRRALLV
jgi:hypothetical protein